MTGIDLNTAFDNKDVITQIHDLKKGKQDKLTAGENITIVDNVISATGGGTWGSITGTLSDQTDLQTALNGKQATGDYATNTALTEGLATKQDVGNYATQTDLQQGLATRQPLGDYQARLTAGDNITIENNVISAAGSGGGANNLSGQDEVLSNAVYRKVNLLQDSTYLANAISSVWYRNTGQNEDGSMTQKAITDAINAKSHPTVSEMYDNATAIDQAYNAIYYSTYDKCHITGEVSFYGRDGGMTTIVNINGSFVYHNGWFYGIGTLRKYNGSTWLSAETIKKFNVYGSSMMPAYTVSIDYRNVNSTTDDYAAVTDEDITMPGYSSTSLTRVRY